MPKMESYEELHVTGQGEPAATFHVSRDTCSLTPACAAFRSVSSFYSRPTRYANDGKRDYAHLAASYVASTIWAAISALGPVKKIERCDRGEGHYDGFAMKTVEPVSMRKLVPIIVRQGLSLI
jgi:hypothetical protein